MTDYHTPGQYIEEIETGAKPIDGVSTTVAAMMGVTECGPDQGRPAKVRSFAEYKRLFGGNLSEGYGEFRYLPYAVEGFFNNGGNELYIKRIVGSGAKPATCSLLPDSIEISASSPGEWGNRIRVGVEPQGDVKEEYIFTIACEIPEGTRIDEKFEHLSLDPSNEGYFEKIINSKSGLIRVVDKKPGDSGRNPVIDPPGSFLSLSNGVEGSISINLFKNIGFADFESIDDISLIAVPGITDAGLQQMLLDHCELMKDRFAVLEVNSQIDINQLERYIDHLNSSYAAIYYPWLKIRKISKNSEILIPPSGHILGLYARNDKERGVHKLPGNMEIRGILGLASQPDDRQQANIHDKRINVIRRFSGRGILTSGSRTLSSDTLFSYINVRRLIIYLKQSINKSLGWVVFEPNNEKLWARVRLTVTEFLSRVWHDRALMGTKAEQAFYVRCDRTTMTNNDILNGKLILEIGVALLKPAEFVIIRLMQNY